MTWTQALAILLRAAAAVFGTDVRNGVHVQVTAGGGWVIMPLDDEWQLLWNSDPADGILVDARLYQDAPARPVWVVTLECFGGLRADRWVADVQSAIQGAATPDPVLALGRALDAGLRATHAAGTGSADTVKT